VDFVRGIWRIVMRSENNFWDTNLIYKCYGGSISYGTNTADSDIDLKGICIPPKEYLLGLHKFEQKEIEEPDTVIYSLEKFVRLALKCNPNIVEMLFVRENHVLFCNKWGKELLDIREEFLSKQARHSFGGYAHAQLQQMEKRKYPNSKRRAEVGKYGYSLKNAYHLIRLLKMGIEIMTEGTLHVFRSDKKYLMEIRNGKYSLEEIKTESKRLFDLFEIAYVKSDLRIIADFNKINDWLVDIQERYLRRLHRHKGYHDVEEFYPE
jgi:predicted nucleotidyltransferase